MNVKEQITMIDGDLGKDITVPTKIGERYFTWYISPLDFRQALEAIFKNDRVDNIRIKEGRIAKTLREAKDKVGLK